MADENKWTNGNQRNAGTLDTDLCHSEAGLYEIHVKGQLNSRWSEWLEGLEVKLLENGEMILYGPIIDQAALMGVLNKLSRLNLTLLSLNEVKKKNEKGDKMSNTQTLNRNFDAIAWGAIFIWWGISDLVTSLPEGTGALGIGLILIGVNLARVLNGIPANGFSTTIGILALIWGGLELAGALLSLPFELPIFAILLIVLGIIVLVPAFTKS